MSGKFEKNKSKSQRKRTAFVITAILAAVLVLALGMVLVNRQPSGGEKTPESQIAETTGPVQTTPKSTAVPLDYELQVIDIGSYTGMYMEDGSDEILSNILMIQVVNKGDEPIQYGQITMTLGEETAEFTLTTLNPGATMVLLEQNRMAYSKDVDYSAAQIVSKNVAFFQYPLEMHQDKLDIQILNGAINVSNISGQDIPGAISIYYKNQAEGIYYGGITYMIRLEDGMKADELRQVMANHFSDSGSEIMFITIAE